MNQELLARLIQCRFYDILAMAKAARGGQSLGFDANRAFANGGQHATLPGNGPKERLCYWVAENCDNASLLAQLPAMEEQARQYYANNPRPQVRRPRQPASIPAPPSTSQVMAEVAAEMGVTLAPQPAAVQPARNVPAPIDPTATGAAGELAAILARIMAQQTAQVNPDQVAEICRREINRALAGITAPRPIDVTSTNAAGETVTVNLPPQHPQFEDLLRYASMRKRAKRPGEQGQRFNVWISGPAGAGKTYAAESVALALNLPFYSCGALSEEFSLLGYKTPDGTLIRTPFRDAWENGGVFLWDEIDRSAAAAVIALNAGLSAGMVAFPDGIVRRHPDCVIIATANTMGNGPTFEYSAAEQMDKSSMDRFIRMPWQYDTAWEIAASGNEAWARKVIRWRERVNSAAGIKHIISPRATFDGADMLANGIPEAQVIAVLVRAGLTDTQWAQVA